MATKKEVLEAYWNDFLNSATKQQLFDFANQGDRDAQFKVGENFYYGENGFKENEERAITWYQKAASQGHEYAIERLYEIEQWRNEEN